MAAKSRTKKKPAKAARKQPREESAARLLLSSMGPTDGPSMVMADRKPRRVLCLDRAFQGNDPLKTNTVLAMRSRGIDFHTV